MQIGTLTTAATADASCLTLAASPAFADAGIPTQTDPPIVDESSDQSPVNPNNEQNYSLDFDKDSENADTAPQIDGQAGKGTVFRGSKTMPQPYPKEFRDDVIRVVQTRDSKTTIAQIAKDFGVHEGTINKWIRQADIDAGNKPGNTSDESAELREMRRRNRLLEQENEVLRRAAAYLSQANLPSKGSTRS
jgi:transposase